MDAYSSILIIDESCTKKLLKYKECLMKYIQSM